MGRLGVARFYLDMKEVQDFLQRMVFRFGQLHILRGVNSVRGPMPGHIFMIATCFLFFVFFRPVNSRCSMWVLLVGAVSTSPTRGNHG